MGNQVGMHTYTHACTHSYQSVGQEDRQMGHSNGATQKHTFLCTTT